MISSVSPYSGGGKSTIANLLARFWDVKSSSIKIWLKNRINKEFNLWEQSS